MSGIVFALELLAAGAAGVFIFVLLMSGASSKEIGKNTRGGRRFNGLGGKSGR